MRRFCICFSLLILSVPLTALGQDQYGHWYDGVGHFYVNPYAGGITPDRPWLATGSQADFGLDLGYNFSPAWSAEFDFNYARLKYRYVTGDHVTVDHGAVNGLRVFNRGGVFSPYLLLGVGALHNSSPAGLANQVFLSSGTNFMAQGGVGAFIRLWENSDASATFSLRPEARARWTDTSVRYLNSAGDLIHASNPVDFIYVLGFTFSFGPGRPPAPVAAAPPPPPPAPPPPPPPPPKPQCPGMAPGEVVPAGTAVDENGCPIRGDVVLQGVNFETDSAVLTGGSKPVLDKVAAGLREHPRLRIEVQGHTDSTGSARHNQGLSERRAEAVRDYLQSQGVSASQMTTRGFGQTQPIATNATADGRAQNRRVVMHVLENPGDVTIRKEGQAQPQP